MFCCVRGQNEAVKIDFEEERKELTLGGEILKENFCRRKRKNWRRQNSRNSSKYRTLQWLRLPRKIRMHIFFIRGQEKNVRFVQTRQSLVAETPLMVADSASPGSHLCSPSRQSSSSGFSSSRLLSSLQGYHWLLLEQQLKPLSPYCYDVMMIPAQILKITIISSGAANEERKEKPTRLVVRAGQVTTSLTISPSSPTTTSVISSIWCQAGSELQSIGLAGGPPQQHLASGAAYQAKFNITVRIINDEHFYWSW